MLADGSARLQEIAENLHRSELTVQEHAEHVAEWVRVLEEKRKATEVSAQVAHKPKGGRPEGGISAASRALRLPRDKVSRALKIAAIMPAAKEAARSAGLEDNQGALLKVTPEAPRRRVHGGSAAARVLFPYPCARRAAAGPERPS